MEYMCFVDDDSNRCVLVICLQISHFGLMQGLQKSPSVLSGGILALTRMACKLFPFLKLLLEYSQKLYRLPYPVLKENVFSIKCS